MSYFRNCHTDIIFNVTLRIHYVVDTNVFHTLPLFKLKLLSAEARSCVHACLITQTVKLVAKRQIKTKPVYPAFSAS